MDENCWPIKEKKILITGGSGYLGTCLLEKIFDKSSIYYLLDLAFHKEIQKLAARNNNIKLIQSNIINLDELRISLKDISPDLIFHFAANLDRSRSFSIYDKLYRVNVQGTLNLLETLKDVSYQCFMFSSTSEVYGSNNPVPFSESQIPEPLSPYSLTKLMSEELIRTLATVNQKPWLIVRIFNFFGPSMPENTFVPQLVNAWKNGREFIMTRGEQKRDYLFIDDVLYYMVKLTELPLKGGVVNICGGASFSMSEVAEWVRQLSGNKLKISMSLPYRENELWNNTGDNTKLLSLVPPRDHMGLKSWLQGLV